MDVDEWEANLEKIGVIKPRYHVVQQIDGTCNIVLGNPYLNPPAVKKGLTREEALAFMKLLK
jgi:hypothetical protein